MPTMPCNCKAGIRAEIATPVVPLIASTLIVLAEEPKSTRPWMMAVLATLEAVTTTPEAPIVSTPVAPAPVELAVLKVLMARFDVPPPLLSKIKPAKVLSP